MRTRGMRTRTVVASVLLFALAGCGGADGGDGVATAGGKASGSASAAPDKGSEKEQMLKFAKCMRENGVPDYPDPEFDENGGTGLNLPEGTDPAAVRAAEAKCKKYMPNGGEPGKADPEVVKQLRKYSQCMRENGVPKFPDPTDQGLQVDNDKLGMGPDDPRLKAAEQACAKHMPPPPSGAPSPQQRTGG